MSHKKNRGGGAYKTLEALNQKIAELEKQNEQLKAELEKINTKIELEDFEKELDLALKNIANFKKISDEIMLENTIFKDNCRQT